jgi:hypothetical protein
LFDNGIYSVMEKKRLRTAGNIIFFICLIWFNIFCTSLPVKADISVIGTVPLVTINITLCDISATDATILWTTNNNSTSQVLYDISSHTSSDEYPHMTAPDSTLVFNHSIHLSGLSAQQTYFFRVKSTVENIVVVSNENSFATLPVKKTSPGKSIGNIESGSVISGSGMTNLAPYVNSSGLFNLSATILSEDRKVTLNIAKGVYGLTSGGNAIKSISIVPGSVTSDNFTDLSILGFIYELGPVSATFNPAVILTIAYNPADLPDGIEENRLTLATWDSFGEKWTELQGVTDTNSHTITTFITHFSHFAIMFHTRPASFIVSDLVITPNQVQIGKNVNIFVTVTNSGDISARYTLTLKVRGMNVINNEISILGGSSETVTFFTVPETAGEYLVDLNGLTGSFSAIDTIIPRSSNTVFEVNSLIVSPQVVQPGQPVTVSLSVINTSLQSSTYRAIVEVNHTPIETRNVILAPGEMKTLSFTLVESVVGVYTVEVAGMSDNFKVAVPHLVRVNPFYRWLISGISAILFIFSIFLVRFIIRRKAKST